MSTKAIIGPVAEVLGKEALEGVGKWLGEDTTKGWFRSGKAILSKTPTGKILSDYIEKEYEPALRKIGQNYLDNNIKAGMKPEVAAEQSYKDASKHVRKQLFGPNDEVLIKSIHTATKQHGVAYGNTMADIMSVYFHDANDSWRSKSVLKTPQNVKGINLSKIGIDINSAYKSPTEGEKALKGGLSWMYTPLVAIPHMGQVANVAFNEGISNTAKAVAEYSLSMAKYGSKSRVLNDIIRSGALYDEFRYQMLEDAKGGGLARQLTHHPGFNWVRRQEINIAAVAGKNSLEEAAERLKIDPNDKWAKYTVQRLGVDVNQVMSTGIQPEHLDKAMHNAANQAIFLRSELNLPHRWEESFSARMFSQYRQFAFRQGAFLANGFHQAWKHGGLPQVAKNVAVFGTLFPVFGEVVHSLENLAQLKDPRQRDYKNPYAEYFDAMGHNAAFGMMYSMVRAGLWNFGKGFLGGPLMSTAEDIFIGLPAHVLKGIAASKEGKTKQAHKQYRQAVTEVTSKLGIAGRLATTAIKSVDKKKKMGEY